MTIESERPIDFGDFHPQKELSNKDEYWFLFNAEQLGITLIGAKDKETGLILTSTFSNPNIRTAALKAWAGARHSRSPGTPWEILEEIQQKDVDVDEKMENTFTGYGHASVGDMARIQVDFSNCPSHLCFEIFASSSINSGQEKSTRYQNEFQGTKIHGLENYLPSGSRHPDFLEMNNEYENLSRLSLGIYSKQIPVITKAFENFFRPSTSKEIGSLRYRVLDCARYSLLFGNLSGMSFETSARDLSRISGMFKGSNVPLYTKVGDFIERFLAPGDDVENYLKFKSEAPGLIRHTEAQRTTQTNLHLLKDFLTSQTNITDEVEINGVFKGLVQQDVELVGGNKFSQAEQMVALYILSLWPGMDYGDVCNWATSQNPQLKGQISQIVFRGHDNYKEMTDLANNSSLALRFKASIGEIRDLNRHRAWGRFTSLPLVNGLPIDANLAYQVLNEGFTLPVYMTEVDAFKNVGKNFEADMRLYYEKLFEFVGLAERKLGKDGDFSFITNLLPLAHVRDFILSGNIKQGLYMTHQRYKNGGHINYRLLAYLSNQLIASSDPYLEGMRLGSKPDPGSREEFFDRS